MAEKSIKAVLWKSHLINHFYKSLIDHFESQRIFYSAVASISVSEKIRKMQYLIFSFIQEKLENNIIGHLFQCLNVILEFYI